MLIFFKQKKTKYTNRKSRKNATILIKSGEE